MWHNSNTSRTSFLLCNLEEERRLRSESWYDCFALLCLVFLRSSSRHCHYAKERILARPGDGQCVSINTRGARGAARQQGMPPRTASCHDTCSLPCHGPRASGNANHCTLQLGMGTGRLTGGWGSGGGEGVGQRPLVSYYIKFFVLLMIVTSFVFQCAEPQNALLSACVCFFHCAT